MKRTKISLIVIIVLLILLGFLSFLKLPINYLTASKIQKDSNGLLNLISFENQYLKLLPTPFLNIINSKFQLNHQNISFDFFLGELDASRSIANNSKISLEVNKGTIENIETNLFSNASILNGSFEDLKIIIENNSDSLAIKSNTFKYQNSNISFDSTFEDQQLNKIKFILTNLNANQLVLLLEPKLQSFFKDINFKSLDISGELTQDLLFIENSTLEIDNGGFISLSGTLDLTNLFNSKINLNGSLIPSNIIEILFKNFNFSDLITLPQGSIDEIQISFDNQIKIDKMNYSLGSSSNIILENFTSNLFFNEYRGDISLINLSKENLLNLKFKNSEILQNINFDYLTADLRLDQNELKINNLNINNDQDLSINASGSLNLIDKEISSISLKIEKFRQFELLNLPLVKMAVNKLNLDYINLESIAYEDHIELNKLEVFKDQSLIANISGDLNLKDFNKSIFKINLIKFLIIL